MLGPLLFLIYANDINRHVHLLGACILYADDTLVYCSGSTMSELKHIIHKIPRLHNRSARIVTGNCDYVTTRTRTSIAIEVDMRNSKARLFHADFNV